VRNFILRDSQDRQAAISLPERMTFNEPEACCQAAVMGLGIAVASLPNLLPYLESGRLVRVLPNWYAENGTLSLYFPTHKMLPAKTRVFVDFVMEKFREQQLSRRFDARIMFVN
jgi:DNA-binding transcriptional LysR family regulator